MPSTAKGDIRVKQNVFRTQANILIHNSNTRSTVEDWKSFRENEGGGGGAETDVETLTLQTSLDR